MFSLRGSQTHFDGGVNHGICDLLRARGLLFGGFVFRKGRFINDHDLSQDLAVVLDGEGRGNFGVIEVLLTLNQCLLLWLTNVTYECNPKQRLPVR